MSEWQQLQERLYPRVRGYSQRSQRSKLFVTVVQAKNLRLPGVHWYPPQAVVVLGPHERRSPLGEAFGPHPIFDWRIELPFTGHESHLAFQVTCEGELLGGCILPLREVLALSSSSTGFHRALPLGAPHERNSPVPSAELSAPDLEHRNVRPELVVAISAVLEGGDVLIPQQERSAEELRLHTSQVRVTLKSLRVEENLAIADVQRGQRKIAPYVMASCGQQTARTKAAFLTAGRQDREKFVFTKMPKATSDFDCGDLLRGSLDRYKAVPSLEERRMNEPEFGYHMRTENGLQITYSNAQFTFWYQQQEVIEFMVYDDLFFYYPDNLVACGTLDLDDAFRVAFTEQGELLDENAKQPRVRMHVTLAPSIATVRPGASTSETSAADGGTGGSTSSRIAGEIELEIEFMQEPVACPTALESTFRQALSQSKKAEELQRESLQYLAEIITSSTVRPSGLPALEDLFSEQKESLAILCCTCAVAAARRMIDHEDRVMVVFENRLENIVQEICEVLLDDGHVLTAELVTCARRAVSYKTIEKAAEAYRRSCRSTSQMEHLLPLGTLLCMLRSTGALLRSSLKRASEAIEPDGSHGSLFFELLERHLVSCGELEVSQPLVVQLGTSSDELGDSPGEVAEYTAAQQKEQLRLGREAMYSNFFPQIDTQRLLDREKEDWQLEVLPGQYPFLIPASVCIGSLCGAIMAFSIVETAVIVHTMDARILCHKDYEHMALMRASCWVMKDSYLDNFMEWVAESPGWFKSIFILSGLMDGKTAFTYMRRRVLKLRELQLESIGEALSPHKVICISGFLRSFADLCQPWVVDPDRPWTSAQVHFLRFETEVLHLLGVQLNDVLARDLKRTEYVARFLVACTNLISFSQRLTEMLLDELGDFLDRAATRAEQVGKLLARQLLEARTNARRRNASFTVSLVGFSTGGVVVQSCLKELQEMVKDGDHVASDIVCDAVMLGTPSRALDEDWSKLRQLVSGRFINGFFAQDSFLLSHQFRRGGARLAGCSPLHAPDVENVPMDPFITTHNEYPEQMPLILQRIFQGT